MRYTTGNRERILFAAKDKSLKPGTGNAYPFDAVYDSSVWNGGIR